MRNDEIIRDIDAVYARFHVAPWLARHMKEVTSVVAFIIDHWQGPAIAREELLAAALTHDLGNIAKMRLDDPTHQEFQKKIMGEEHANTAHWLKIQKKMIAEYGADEHEATATMLREIQADPAIFQLIQDARFHNSEKNAAGDNWAVKILAYADQRVAPSGVVTVLERQQDARARYRPDFKPEDPLTPLEAAIHLIERQLGAQLAVSVESIANESVAPYQNSKALLRVLTHDEDDEEYVTE